MSDASTDRDDRPAEVTDPLLWRLAAAVADTHQPDEHDACDNGSCFGATWPCAPWNNAQEGLRAAQAAPRTDTAEPAAHQDAPETPAGRSAESSPPPPWQSQPDQSPLAITSAA
ncbi:hypothetical protein [Micromonospora sp. NPDC007230]|uniref:hypothetical protein n=1 Tax=Micromonospora sp. NPDC007230 TaxID=3364237 RepID=UPI0036B37C56